MITQYVDDSTKLVKQTQDGIHPAETEHHIHKLVKQMQKLKQAIHYIESLQSEAVPDSAIASRLHRDKRTLWRMLAHLQSAVGHLRGHDWGIFRK